MAAALRPAIRDAIVASAHGPRTRSPRICNSAPATAGGAASVAGVSWRRAAPWLAIFAVVAVAGAAGLRLPGLSGSGGAAEPGGGDGRVTRVVDGDTVHVRVAGRDETVRYIGVDTPETKKPGTPVQCFGKAATAENERLVDGERVRLRYDVERRDRYGRLLAYVYRARDGLWVNARLVRDGFATTLTIPPNVAHARAFRSFEQRAQRAGEGLWSAC
jgi:micrococcal nuclease